jgi:hypothetical protein
LGKENAVRVVEFEGTLGQGGQIALPPDIAGEIPAGKHVRIVVMWEASDLDPAWRAAGAKQFAASYAPEDAIYEQLIDDTAVR